MGHRNSITAHRNRIIYSEYVSGIDLEELSRVHALSKHTLGAIIRQERHKMAVGVEDYYRQQRRASARANRDQ